MRVRVGREAHGFVGWRNGEAFQPIQHALVAQAAPARVQINKAAAAPPPLDGEIVGADVVQSELAENAFRRWPERAGGVLHGRTTKCRPPGLVPKLRRRDAAANEKPLPYDTGA